MTVQKKQLGNGLKKLLKLKGKERIAIETKIKLNEFKFLFVIIDVDSREILAIKASFLRNGLKSLIF